MKRDPDLQALQALVAIAKAGSISAASRSLGISQQAVSLRVRSLELDTGLRLLVRTHQGSKLTANGELVVGWAEQLLASAQTFASAVDLLRDDGNRTLRLSASLTIAEHLAPDWIAKWRMLVGSQGPLTQLSAANSDAVIDAVRSGDVDLGFIESAHLPSDLSSRVVGQDTIGVIVSRDHPWAGQQKVSIAELAAEPLVLREHGSGTRQVLEDALSKAGFPVIAAPALVASSNLGVRSAVIAGAGPGVLSTLSVADDVAAGRLVQVQVPDLHLSRSLRAVWLGRVPSPAARDFLQQIQTVSFSAV